VPEYPDGCSRREKTQGLINFRHFKKMQLCLSFQERHRFSKFPFFMSLKDCLIFAFREVD
jgi:hypothetical protein